MGVRYDVDIVFVGLGILRGSSGGVAMVMTLGTAVANLGRKGLRRQRSDLGLEQ